MSSPHKLSAWLTTLATTLTLSWMAAAVDRLYQGTERLVFENVKTSQEELLFGLLVILTTSLPLAVFVRAALHEKSMTWGRAWLVNVGSALCISLIAAAMDRAYGSVAALCVGDPAGDGHVRRSLGFAGLMVATACLPLGRLVFETARQ